jgi:hypothetical protein
MGMPYIQITRNSGRLEKIKASYNPSAKALTRNGMYVAHLSPVTWHAFPFEGSRVSWGNLHRPKRDGKAKFKPL